MDAARILERNMFRCEEVDSTDYSMFPLASEEEFACMESQAMDNSIVHIFPFVRTSEAGDYIEIYVFDIMLYPISCFRRFIISEGLRMPEEEEEAFFAYAKEKTDCSEDAEEEFRSFADKVCDVFPHWHFRPYSIRCKERALHHMYFASHRSGPRETLYKAGLWNIAFKLDEISSYNLIGSSPTDIFDVPFNLLRILNKPLLVENLFEQDKLEQAVNVYRTYSSIIGNTLPSSGQWKYLEELYNNDGLFAGHRFMRSLYNRLSGPVSGFSLENYRKFLTYRDQIPQFRKMKLPKEGDVYSEVEKLETILEYSKEDDEINLLIQSRKNQTSYEYEGEKYLVRMPASSLDFCMEAISQSNCLLDSYIEEHAEGETTILFLRRKEEPKKSFVTLEIDNDHSIRQAYGSCNSLPSKEVYLFLKEYAQHNWLLYDPYSLISGSIGAESLFEEDGNDELQEYFAELKEKHDRTHVEFEEDATEFVQLCFLDCISTECSVNEQPEENMGRR